MRVYGYCARCSKFKPVNASPTHQPIKGVWIGVCGACKKFKR